MPSCCSLVASPLQRGHHSLREYNHTLRRTLFSSLEPRYSYTSPTHGQQAFGPHTTLPPSASLSTTVNNYLAGVAAAPFACTPALPGSRLSRRIVPSFESTASVSFILMNGYGRNSLYSLKLSSSRTPGCYIPQIVGHAGPFRTCFHTP